MPKAVKLHEIVDVLDFQGREWQSYLDPESGEIVTLTEDDQWLLRSEEDGDEEELDDLPEWQRERLETLRDVVGSRRWLYLPDAFDVHEWAIMERFCRSVEDATARDELLDAVHGRGAFRHFKHTVSRLGLRDHWDDYREEALEEIARDWLEGHGLEWEETRRAGSPASRSGRGAGSGAGSGGPEGGTVPARAALERLRVGNRRFVAGERRLGSGTDLERRRELVAGQRPFAVVLGCSDSRASPEIVFDQGLGDLFVIRVAGHVAGPHELGSVEFAVGQLGARLVVVLGHTGCGAVEATLDALAGRGEASTSENLGAIVEGIRPAVEPLWRSDLAEDAEALSREAVRAHVRATAERVRRGSELLAELARGDGLVVVGAVYELESGAVELFDGVPGEG